jgi:general secretion pathway protein L
VILPTLIILGILAMLVAGMYTQRAWNEREYAQRLLSEIQLLERQVAQGQRMDDEGERFLARIEQLKEYKLRTGRDLAALLELTRLLPEDAWVTQLDLGQSDLTLAGEANQAGSLVKTIDGSPLFENSEFSMPLQRLENREIFRLRVKREAQK